jgi:hypothetical protein
MRYGTDMAQLEETIGNYLCFHVKALAFGVGKATILVLLIDTSATLANVSSSTFRECFVIVHKCNLQMIKSY